MNKLGRLVIAVFLIGGALALAGCAQDDTTTTASGTPGVFGPGPGPTPGPGPGPTPGPTGNRVQLLVSSAQMPSAGTTTIDLTAVVLDANGQAAAGSTVVFSTGTDPSAFITNISGGGVTDANGRVTAKLNVGSDKTNRTVTITATSSGASAQAPVQIVGSTVTMNATGSNLPDDGSSPVTLSITAKDSAGNTVSGVPVTLTKTGTGNVTLTPTAGVTNASGQLAVTVGGAAAGSVTVTASALGATATTNFTVTSTAATFGIEQTTNTTTGAVTLNPTLVAMKIGDSLVVQVNAPAAATVTFATTIGSWNGGGLTLDMAVVAGKASATLTTTQAGVANVQVFDPLAPSNNDSLTVSMTAATAAKITLQATPSVVLKSVGTTTGVSTLVATVTDASGLPVGDAPVAFSIVNPTGGGESLTPVVAFSASTATTSLALGQARTTFTSGSLSSDAGGVRIRASVLGTSVATNTTPSGPDAAIVISGTAGSIAFGIATVIEEAGNGTDYVRAMSVLVADVNGSPAPAGTVVNLSLWPIAWSTGSGCFPDPDSISGVQGTFLNEDANENLILDPNEDGTRKYYASGSTTTTSFSCTTPTPPTPPVCTSGPPVTSAAGTKDGLLTPPNSAGGIVPGTVTTDANGVATFNLTYGKTSAIWIVTRLRARTVVQGTEALSEIQMRLDPTVPDVTPCKLPNSPYKF